ncbi:polynucleotide kinase-phosphatase [Actinocatenispora rupis]|uniref:Polynucleotide kinase-phosphatase n=1 Tax=Actinocatenispora rupis TaxID=519421 RepID=A0A8J3NGF8_9ACTN|nr:polynucleotide kinase-phosphatase [Actinocatenispora rupis]GID15890.1 polynucleotide kinase-phosphatase [Actinocatenispora rupis]
MTEIAVPDLALVALVGVSGSGKSTFARTHFRPTQVLSSDAFRAMVADDENDQSASAAAFDALHHVAGLRLRAGRLTVVDATNTQRYARAELVRVAREHDVLPVAIVLDLPEQVCAERTEARSDRHVSRRVLRRQRDELRRGLRGLRREGFRKVYVLSTPEEVDAAVVTYEKQYNDRRELTGPFDIVGDVHGCRAELESLLTGLGWRIDRDADGAAVGASHPAGRTAVFVGDLVDRGPDTPGVLRLVMGMVAAGTALSVCGNHEQKLARKLAGRDVTVRHGLETTLAQFEKLDPVAVQGFHEFCDGLVSHYVLDGGRLVVAHAGLKEEYQGRSSARVRSFCLYGETTGETDEYGLPVRYPWAADYRGDATVVYGHTPVPEPEWLNDTLCVDTGCVFGGSLTALRYPEREIVSVPAERVWYEPVRPLAPPPREDDLLDVADVTGRRRIDTGYGAVTVGAEESAAALEVLSRFAVDPRLLPWLPPTMAPCSTSTVDGYLEYPTEAFEDYRKAGVTRVVCEEKHMGSRAVVLVGRDDDAFPVPGPGALYTRTGRSFFTDGTGEALLRRVRAAAAGLFEELSTRWLLLDAELLPWSAKAGQLIRDEYAPVAAAAGAALPAALSTVDAAVARGLDLGALRDRLAARAASAAAYAEVYQRYSWPTDGLTGLRLAPFAVLASEGASHAGRDHGWQLDRADRLAAADPELIASTRRIVVDTTDPDSVRAGTDWWLALTAAGGEGMVVKPYHGLSTPDGGRQGQPGIKCRGREYLRIIYGPDYTEPATLARLRDRKLGRKRSLAWREHVLGLAALDRLAAGAPLYRVHEVVAAILACESEPVDPRL